MLFSDPQQQLCLLLFLFVGDEARDRDLEIKHASIQLVQALLAAVPDPHCQLQLSVLD